MSKSFQKNYIEDGLVELEKDLANFQLTFQKKSKQYKSTLGF